MHHFSQVLKEVLEGKDISSGDDLSGSVLFFFVFGLLFVWPWLWCLGVGLLKLLLLPLAVTLDALTACRDALTAWLPGLRRRRPDPTAAALRRIQREVEGMHREPQYEQRMCPVCLEDFQADSDAGIKRMTCGHRFHR